MNRQELEADCRRDAEQWMEATLYMPKGKNYVAIRDKLASLMADKAELIVALEVANNKLDKKPLS